jgi:coenzyme F420-reducing hydrogenase delta subunit
MTAKSPVIHLFYCANSMTEDEVQSLRGRLDAGELRTLSVPCSGKVTIPYLLKAFEKGADGVVICCCPPAQCRNLEGNLRAARRTHAVDALLEEVGLGKDRMLILTVEQGQMEKVTESMEQFRNRLCAASTAVCEKPASTRLRSGKRSLDTSDRQETAA